MRWVSPSGMLLRPIKDLSVAFSVDLIAQRKNRSPVLAHFLRTTLEVRSDLRKAARTRGDAKQN
jgi:hypothetical protein